MRRIQSKLLLLSLALILSTTAGFSLSYYHLIRRNARESSRLRLEIAFSIIREDIQARIATESARIDDFFQQVSAIPWELYWYETKKDKGEFFSDPTYSSYIVSIGEEFRRFSRFVAADRISLYGEDGRLIVTYFKGEDTEIVGTYVATPGGEDTFLSTSSYSRALITRRPLPVSPLPSGVSPRYTGYIPDFPATGHFSDGARFGLKIAYPVFHESNKVGVMVVEIPYTRGLLEKYAQLSRTEVVINGTHGMYVGTLALQIQEINDCPFSGRTGTNEPLTQVIGGEDYYLNCLELRNIRGGIAGTVTVYLSRNEEKREIAVMIRLILIIGLIITFLSLTLVLILSRSTLRLIGDLTDAASLIASGELETDLPVRGGDELARLARSVRKMRDAIIGQISLLEKKISEQDVMTAELEESREKLAATLKSIGEGVITCDRDGRIVNLNAVAEDLTGWSASNVRGMGIEELFQVVDSSTGEPLENPVYSTLGGRYEPKLAGDILLRNRTGRVFPLSENCNPIRDKDGRVLGAVIIFRDMTEELALQERFRQSQKMDAVGQLAGGIAHDFNNMLGGIIGAAELVVSQLEGAGESAEYANLILESAERAADLAAKLLAFSRKQVAQPAAVNIHIVINETVALLKNTLDKRISIDTSGLDADRSTVKGDRSLLQSVFLNLGINASHAMPEGGALAFVSERASLDRHYCGESPFPLAPGEYLKLSVRDTGEGIPTENLERIFEPFFTTKKQGKGTGLGLAAAYGTVLQHKGAISVTSEVGEGTTFTLLLPLTEEDATGDSMEKGTVKGEGRILLVDDEKVMRATGKALLENLGYRVELAGCGTEGIEIFRREKDRIDLVVLDMIMPDMNGKDCFREMKKIRQDITIVIASGFINSGDLEDLTSRGLNGFIQKPYKARDISQLISRLLS